MLGAKRKKSMVVLTLTAEEMKLARDVILQFRNKVIRAGGPTEDLDALLLKLL